MNKNVRILITTLLTLSISFMSHASSGYKVTNLVASDASAANQDHRLINPWGLTFTLSGDLIVADNGVADSASPFLATSYEENGDTRALNIFGLVDNLITSVNPTGLESNHNRHDFIFGTGPTGPAGLLFASEAGYILGYNEHVNTSSALVVKDRTSFNSVYKGLALAEVNGEHQHIFAADFFNGTIDEFDNNFNFVKSFTDTNPDLAGYAPFNIRNINGLLYVTYAKQRLPAKHDDDPMGTGFVDVFHANGTLKQRLISNGVLKSPWGLALAPDNFGPFSDALLVGNFTDGLIHAYNINTGVLLGTLSDQSNTPIAIPGLWSIKFGPKDRDNDKSGDKDDEQRPKLYFTSGPDEEAGGLVGVIVKN